MPDKEGEGRSWSTETSIADRRLPIPESPLCSEFDYERFKLAFEVSVYFSFDYG